MRGRVTTVMEVVGWCAAVAGVALWSVPAAFVSGGVSMLAAGVVLGRDG